jgi:hypothetical protein
VNAGLPSGSPNTPVTDPAAGCGCPRLPVVGAFLVSAGQLHPVAEVGQFELMHYLPETSAMNPATKRWISAGGRL